MSTLATYYVHVTLVAPEGEDADVERHEPTNAQLEALVVAEVRAKYNLEAHVRAERTDS